MGKVKKTPVKVTADFYGFILSLLVRTRYLIGCLCLNVFRVLNSCVIYYFTGWKATEDFKFFPGMIEIFNFKTN